METASAAALVASVLIAAAAFVFVWPQIVALARLVGNTVATAPRDHVAFLSTRFFGDHENYRLAFEWAAILIVSVWWVPVRMARVRGQSLNRGLLAGGATTLALVLVLLQLPYRAMYQAEFDAVTWRGQRCYLFGTRGDDLLLYCPELDPPRTRAVVGDTSVERVGIRMNPFGDGSVPSQEKP